MMTAPEVVLGVTGSIGAYKAGDLVRSLRDAGYAVTCVMTQRATRFLAPTTLQALSERPVYADLFDPSAPHIIHTTLADRARVVLVAPATANIIGKFAGGLADDLLSCLLLATRAKVVFAPAMNVHMWQHPSVQRNVTTLKRLGVRFVGPDVGKLACGYEAIGHLAEPDEILRLVRQLAPATAVPAAAAPAARAAAKRPAKRAPRRKR
jgi:phosphopantothenoylcysteine decarboxylase/phosphopantothenate--cysteine ligase